MGAFKTFWQALRDLHDELFLFAGVSVLWWLGILLVVPGPPVTAGLYSLACRTAHEQRVEFGFFWQEIRQRFGKSWQLAAVNLFALVVVLVNFLFYWNLQNFLRYAVVVWAYLFLLWLGVQLYLFPLLFEMEEPRLRWLLRNAVLLPLIRPGYTLLLLLLLLAATALGLVLPFLLLIVWPALVALVGARATAAMVEEVAARRAPSSGPES
ncbi:MAG: hypothetical protein QHJ81_13335 [Anaerolineae bacterium]|nr:hypothetical protein [Anaerolineae bacterium]